MASTFNYIFPFFVVVGLACAALPVNCGAALSPDIATTIKTKMSTLASGGNLDIADSDIAARNALPELYRRRGYRGLWQRAESIEQMVSAVETAAEEGLNPEDYHYRAITTLQARIKHAARAKVIDQANRDILLTDSLIRLAYHLYYGKVDPRRFTPQWTFTRELRHSDPLKRIQQVVADGEVTIFLDGLKPKNRYYSELKQALKKYRDIKKAGGWNSFTKGPVLQMGQWDARVDQLRHRLSLTDGPLEPSADPNYFDAAVEAALRRFQARHYLSSHGRLDRSTQQELNRTPDDLISQIRANLERARWVMHDIPDRFVLVDIAGYKVYLIEKDQIVKRYRAQVGHPYRETPVFRAMIELIVFNPTWTVPPGILRDDILPKIREDIRYLEEANLSLVNLDGVKIDPASIDWHKVRANSFPLRLRKPPGPDNPMGEVKILFPNSYLVYIHDTNEKEKFDDDWRAASSGCIRVENPLDLAVELLSDTKAWSHDQIRKLVASGQTKAVSLKHPVPILLLYQSVSVDRQEQVYFREDVYGRDANIVEGLSRPFTFHLPVPIRESAR